MTDDGKVVDFLVVDSSVLIRRAPLKDLAGKVYSVSGVVSEIKDANTRASLQVLPYEFHFKEPSSDSIKFVSQFARKTGDYTNLSAVDLNLIALTYQLCKENMDKDEFDQLKQEPIKNYQPLINANTLGTKEKPVNIVGFYLPPRATKKSESNNLENDLAKTLDNQLKLDENNNNDDQNETEQQLEEPKLVKQVQIEKEYNANYDDKNKNENENESHDVDDGDNDDDNDDDDEAGWIKPSNLKEMKKLSILESEQQELNNVKFKVGCMTSDFSMQNVLIQIGIPVLSVDGLLIKKPRSYVLRCITCMKVTTNMSKLFCPNCGYKSLERVVVTVDADGNRIYRGRKKLITKGLRYSLPMPHGGKHPNYPILSEDQPQAQNLPSKKSLVKNDPLDPDYASYSSPFVTKDVHSRAARLGIRANKTNRFNKRH